MPAYIKPKMAQQQQGNTNKQGQNEWDKTLAQARMAMMMDGKTALGLALGKLIRGAWDHEQEAAKRRKLDAYDNQGIQQRMDNSALAQDDAQKFRDANQWASNPALSPAFLPGEQNDMQKFREEQPKTVADGVMGAFSSLYNAGMDAARDKAKGTLLDYMSKLVGGR